jgi:hypothetical protein
VIDYWAKERDYQNELANRIEGVRDDIQGTELAQEVACEVDGGGKELNKRRENVR